MQGHKLVARLQSGRRGTLVFCQAGKKLEEGLEWEDALCWQGSRHLTASGKTDAPGQRWRAAHIEGVSTGNTAAPLWDQPVKQPLLMPWNQLYINLCWKGMVTLCRCWWNTVGPKSLSPLVKMLLFCIYFSINRHLFIEQIWLFVPWSAEIVQNFIFSNINKFFNFVFWIPLNDKTMFHQNKCIFSVNHKVVFKVGFNSKRRKLKPFSYKTLDQIYVTVT